MLQACCKPVVSLFEASSRVLSTLPRAVLQLDPVLSRRSSARHTRLLYRVKYRGRGYTHSARRKHPPNPPARPTMPFLEDIKCASKPKGVHSTQAAPGRAVQAHLIGATALPRSGRHPACRRAAHLARRWRLDISCGSAPRRQRRRLIPARGSAPGIEHPNAIAGQRPASSGPQDLGGFAPTRADPAISRSGFRLSCPTD
jgi:hypothetical protein